MIGRPVLDFVTPESRAEVAGAIERGNGETYQHSILRADGTTVLVGARGRSMTVGGAVVRMTSIRDLEEHRQSELARRESERQLAAVAATAPGAIHAFRRRPDGTREHPYASPAVRDVLGVGADELRGDASLARKYFLADDLAALDRSVEESARTLEPWRVEFRVNHPDKGLIWIAGHSVPTREHDGRIIWQGFLQDISERKRAEAALEESRMKLLHAQKMDAIGRLSGGVAHDFNNLLTIISGHVSLLETAGDVTPSQAESLTKISESTERAANLTRQILAFSRRQPMQVRALDLNDVVKSMGKMLCRLVGADITLEVRCCERSEPLRADSGMLEQVLLNLVVNARDAMPKGGRLVIETATQDAEARKHRS